MILEPGYYSIFVLIDDGTWEQPTYKITKPMEEHVFIFTVEAAHGAFVSYGLGDDSDCPPENARNFDDLILWKKEN